MADLHPATATILQYFTYAHLPEPLQRISKPLGDLATEMAHLLPQGAELTAGLRKLLEAKDCFVRAGLQHIRSSEGTVISEPSDSIGRSTQVL